MTHHASFDQIKKHLNQQLLGQSDLIDCLLIALLTNGHLLVEGAPGLAKTRAIKCLAACLDGTFHRIQFTPDLLPADITGTDVFLPNESRFQFQHGPIFHHLILADEINRAPAKVQSALLEAMGERQISIGQHTYPLPEIFLVMATQNPLEHQGTHPLPEAQLDRFLLKITLQAPDAATEKSILELHRRELSNTSPEPAPKLSLAQILEARQSVLAVHLADTVEDYLIELVMATRTPERYQKSWGDWLTHGASPRATLALDRTSKALAWLEGRDYVTPSDIQRLAPWVLAHRLGFSYQAQAANITPSNFIDQLIASVTCP
jgi:MoxR-like ATPase